VHGVKIIIVNVFMMDVLFHIYMRILRDENMRISSLNTNIQAYRPILFKRF
jgi:hypothetical protein